MTLLVNFFIWAMLSNEIRTLFLSVYLLRDFYDSLVLTPFSKCLVLTIFLLNLNSFLVFGFDMQKIRFYIILSFFNRHTWNMHNKCVPSIRIKLNEIKISKISGKNGSWTNLFQEEIFSGYDKIWIKTKILYKVYRQIKRAQTSFSML